MDYQYDAFISYRHAEVDSAVAKDIQHWLEHFHVPKSIQEASGKKKINRVFRDKEELPLSMNLGETITDALIHSEYLIVICSPRTQESQWVQREIEAFLETHDLEHVLAVIAEGEPDEVIPKILTYQETTSVNENGEEITDKEDLEPLGCDYRVGKRKAHKEELPRLAASLLNCSYDTLIQRARQYRMRLISGILATILALALGFSGYVLYSNQKIKTNYENALRAQSEYLASESIKSLNNDDRFTAMALALEALPSESNDRPYVAKAEYALNEACLAYVNLTNANSNLIPGATFNLDSKIKSLCAPENKTYFAVLDQSEKISIFNCKNNSFVNTITVNNNSNSIELIGITQNDFLLFYCGSKVFCYSLPDCKEIWHFNNNTDNEIDINSALMTEDETIISSHDSLIRLANASGKVIKQYKLPSFPDGINGLQNTDPGSITTIGEVVDQKIPILVMVDMDDTHSFNTGYIPAIIDFESGEINYYPLDFGDPVMVGLNTSGNLVVHSIDNVMKSSDYFFGLNRLYTSTNHVSCIDSDTKEILWDNKVDSVQFMNETTINNINFINSETDTQDAVLVTFSNIILIYDPVNGEQLKKTEVTGSICGIGIYDDSISFVTRDGYYGFTGLDFDPVYTVRFFQDSIDFGWVKSGLILIPNDQFLIRYAFGVNDKSFQPIRFDSPPDMNEDDSSLYPSDTLIEDDCIAFLCDKSLYYSNGALDQKLKAINLTDYRCESIMGQLSNNNLLMENWDYKNPILEMDFKSGTIEPFLIPGITNPKEYHSAESFQLVNDTVFYSYFLRNYTENVNSLWCGYFNLNEKTPVNINLGSEKEEVDDIRFSISDNKQTAIVFVDYYNKNNSKAIMVNLVDGTYKQLKTSTANPDSKCSWFISDKQSPIFALSEDHSISVWDSSGTIINQISNIKGSVLGLHFMDDGTLLCLTDNGYQSGQLFQYGKEYSKVLHKMEISLDSLSKEQEWDYVDDNYLIIQCDSYASIIDLNQWQLLSTVPSRGYQKKSDCFIDVDEFEKKNSFGYRKRYTTDSLIAEAKRQLGNFKLSDIQRAEYGLN